MRAGERKHLVQLQSPIGVTDSIGERDTSWVDVGNPVYASIKPLGGRALHLAMQAQSSTTHELNIRFDSSIADIDYTWRVVFGSRIFTIESSIDKNEESKEIILLCSESRRTE